MTIPLSKKSMTIPRSGIRRIFDLTPKYDNVINFTLGEPDFETPDHVKEAAFDAIKEGYTHYTPNAGLKEFREAVADKVKRENNLDIDPETEVIATPGGLGSLFLGVYATIDDGDEVLITDPGYVSYSSEVLMAGGKPIHIPVFEENRFAVKPEDIEEKITSKTKAIILNYPANPTGSTLTHKDLTAICDIAHEHDLLVISDEVYERITYDNITHYSIASLSDMKDRTLSVFSLSKTYAMTGWRIGYAVGSENVIKEMTKLQEHVSAHPSAVSQKAAVAALLGSQDCVRKMVEEYSMRRKLVYKRINEIEGISCLKPDGAFYAFVNIKELGINSYDAMIWCLEKSRVALIPGSEFGPHGEGYLRLSYSVSRDKIESGIDRISEAVGKIASNHNGKH